MKDTPMVTPQKCMRNDETAFVFNYGNCVLYYHNDDDDDDDETLPWTPFVMDYFVESMAGFVCYAVDCFG